MKKLIFIGLFLFSFSVAFNFSSFAQTQPTTDITLPNQTSHAESLDDTRKSGSINDDLHVQRVEVIRLVTISGLLGNVQALTSDTTLQRQYFANTVTGKTVEGIAYLYYNKPVDTQQFIAYYGQRAGIVKPAYAQGIGFSGLSPILPLWRAFRNVAYGFLIFVLVVIGFMILFRMKIDPRTVISVQNALPRIIITLILITFSYAIVGLLIDVMYLLIFLTIATLRAGFPISDMPTTLSFYTGGPLTNLFPTLWGIHYNSVGSVTNLIGGSVLRAATTAIGAVTGVLVGNAIVPFNLGGAIGGLVGAGAGALTPNALVSVIVWIAIAFAYIRILITLINAYIEIVLGVILGPVQLMFDAIPNSSAFSSWIKNMVANLAVFPIVSGALLLSQIIVSLVGSTGANFWTPPGLTTEQSGGIVGIIGLGIALMIPNIVKTIKEALKAKAPIQSGAGAIFAPIGTITGVGMQALSAQYYVGNPLGAILKKIKR